VSNTDERRKWPRKDMALKIRLKPLPSPGESLAGEMSAYTKNISTGGLFFEESAEAPVPDGAIFDVEISMPSARFGFTSSRRLEARGRVCRIVKSGEASRCGVALEFMAPPRFVTP
jgi:hypothetical protein